MSYGYEEEDACYMSTRRRMHVLVYLLYKVTISRTFENTYIDLGIGLGLRV
jgi:hypothetical protein